ncbi:MAG: prepilin-type N-terminal cleavage/methylation domain-containing protein [Cyanobacteria bacterium J007]|nr:MAG: prepilin-type N-terminal cleavage/methylation domain-containing protein [Cyanobacteria bacterium J007]
MKTEFQAKFLQHLHSKKEQEGFTLIELLVVVIIIGILAAVALPSLLSQANKAKQVEARNNVGAMNRAQQAFFLEKGRFGAYEELGVGIQTETTNYQYRFNPEAPAENDNVAIIAKTLTKGLKPYVGLVWSEIDATTSESTTRALLCEEKLPQDAGSDPSVSAPAEECGGDMVALGE